MPRYFALCERAVRTLFARALRCCLDSPDHDIALPYLQLVFHLSVCLSFYCSRLVARATLSPRTLDLLRCFLGTFIKRNALPPEVLTPSAAYYRRRAKLPPHRLPWLLSRFLDCLHQRRIVRQIGVQEIKEHPGHAFALGCSDTLNCVSRMRPACHPGRRIPLLNGTIPFLKRVASAHGRLSPLCARPDSGLSRNSCVFAMRRSIALE